jgi:hypothetical protein
MDFQNRAIGRKPFTALGFSNHAHALPDVGAGHEAWDAEWNEQVEAFQRSKGLRQ